MVSKSHGPRRRTREKFRKDKREKLTINKLLKEFEVGSNVSIDINPNSQTKPFRRFQGLTGRVVAKRGQAYLVAVYDGKKQKQVIAKAEHLQAA